LIGNGDDEVIDVDANEQDSAPVKVLCLVLVISDNA
jgi:hypothetical protein